jgi:hypothetical protein
MKTPILVTGTNFKSQLSLMLLAKQTLMVMASGAPLARMEIYSPNIRKTDALLRKSVRSVNRLSLRGPGNDRGQERSRKEKELEMALKNMTCPRPRITLKPLLMEVSRSWSR